MRESTVNARGTFVNRAVRIHANRHCKSHAFGDMHSKSR